MRDLVPTQRIVPEFTPVPRKYRYDGFTPERQRGFIAALAETGSVTAAAKRINMSAVNAYQVRLAPGAESFRAAWEAALAHGVQCLTDIAIDRAREGVAVPVFYKGEQVGERRWYNDRLLMFMLKHHLADRYGANLPRGTRHPDTIAREAAENCPVCKARTQAEAEAAENDTEQSWLDRVFERYQAKVRGERRERLEGNIVAADFTVRQLTHIELILDCGRRGRELIALWTNEPFRSPGASPTPIHASPISEHLDALRRAAWKQAGEPDRPPLCFDRTRPDGSLQGGSTFTERSNARRACERRMAEAQKEWEAAGREDAWAEWKAGGSRLSEA